MRTVLALACSCLVAMVVAAAPPPVGTLLPDPALNDARFKPHQMPFELPDDGVARAEVRSERFYAVLLASPAACSVTEEQRLGIQALFPGRKVFATRFDCDDDEDLVTYTNVKAGVGFIAVFAGRTLAEAKAVLAQAQATGRFPGANIRRLQVVWVSP